MKCGKRPLTIQQAYAAMQRIPEKETGQVPIRKYWCGQHKAWHITSKAKRGRKRGRRQ